MKRTTASLFFLIAIVFTSSVSAQYYYEEWEDPNADYTPGDAGTVDSNQGYYLNCDNMDKNYFTLQKIFRCGDPYVLSAQNVQDPNGLAGHLLRSCVRAERYPGTITDYQGLNEYSNTNLESRTQDSNSIFDPQYPGYPYTFAQMKSKTESKSESTSTTSTNSDHTFFDDIYSGYGSYEECVANYVFDPAFRGPVNATDIERLLAFDILMLYSYADYPMYKADCNDRCFDILLPIFVKYGHFPGNGNEDNWIAKQDYINHSFNFWYEQFAIQRFDYNCNFW